MSKASVQHLLKKWGIVPHQDQGQHFLVDDTILERIVATAKLTGTDRVLEVGSGVATLTALLAQKAHRVVAVEVDPQFKPLLEAFAAVNTNVTLLFSDILKTPFEVIEKAFAFEEEQRYRIVANIPYYLTSRFFATILQYSKLPDSAVILIQKEVAERIVAQSGDQSKLSLSIQLYGTPRIAFQVPRTAFNPMPEVDSALLVIEHIHPWSYAEPERSVWQLITFGFSSKRKKLVNNLMAGLQISREIAVELLEKAGIEPGIRAENLAPEDWVRLAGIVFKK